MVKVLILAPWHDVATTFTYVLANRIEKKLKEKGYDFDFRKFDDFPFLKEMHDEDEKNKRYDRFVPTSDGGFKVIDSNVCCTGFCNGPFCSNRGLQWRGYSLLDSAG